MRRRRRRRCSARSSTYAIIGSAVTAWCRWADGDNTWFADVRNRQGSGMRVIAGEFRSRKLKSLPGLETRPTPDRLRETLFDVLAPRMEGAVFVDAYAGTGAVGIEALSRGAARAIFLEKS